MERSCLNNYSAHRRATYGVKPGRGRHTAEICPEPPSRQRPVTTGGKMSARRLLVPPLTTHRFSPGSLDIPPPQCKAAAAPAAALVRQTKDCRSLYLFVIPCVSLAEFSTIEYVSYYASLLLPRTKVRSIPTLFNRVWNPPTHTHTTSSLLQPSRQDLARLVERIEHPESGGLPGFKDAALYALQTFARSELRFNSVDQLLEALPGYRGSQGVMFAANKQILATSETLLSPIPPYLTLDPKSEREREMMERQGALRHRCSAPYPPCVPLPHQCEAAPPFPLFPRPPFSTP